jgi:hypothetical protein
MRTILRLFVIGLLLCSTTVSAGAVNVTASYVKTLGQSNSEGKFSFVTAGGRVAVDEQGNAYFGTPGGGSYLQKVSPTGQIVWQFMHNVPGFQGTAVDEKYLYTCGSGYYGRIQLQRWLRDTGEAAPGWQYDWENSTKSLNGVQSFKMPNALAVDEKYLFVADISGNEVRRFDKVSGAEAPFNNRLLVVSPTDLALTPKGTLLILTEAAVVEVGKDGKALRVPLISGLHGPTAIDVSRKTGMIYMAEGGSDAELINRVRLYSADGKATDQEIGIGGDFNGKWHPLSFAFSSGAGDITLDPNGGLWVNGYGHRLYLCPMLTHLSPAPQFKPDLTLRGVMGTGLFVDSNLDVYVGGSYKIGWDNQLRWTSGLIGEGPAKLFPTTIDYWPMNPVWSDGKTAIISSMHQNVFYQVNAKNGAALGKSVASGTAAIAGSCVVGRDIFYTGKDRTIQRTTVDLAAPQPFMTLPEGAVPATGALAISPDQQLVYLSNGGETACYQRNGTQVWKAKGIMGTLGEGVLFTSNPDGPGVAVLDAATGEKLKVFGDKEDQGRASLYGLGGMAMGSKDGKDYLFIYANARVLVYQIIIR